MGLDYVTVEREGRVALVRIDRGDGLNPMSVKLARELTEVARSFADDVETTAIVLTGAPGGGFCAGRDLRDPDIRERAEKPLLARRHATGVGPRLCRAWEELEQITIVAVERFAVGAGLALALAADLRVMGEGAHFRAPEVSLGLSMGWGSIPRLVALVGPARAKQILCLSEDRVRAADALAWGLVQEVAPDGTAAERALALARRMAAMPPLTVRMTKSTVNAVALALARSTAHMDTDQLLLAEHGADHAEAVAAYREKRRPRFTGS